MVLKSKLLKKHVNNLKKEYEKHLQKHDINTPEAVHFVGKDKSWLRFKILTEIDELNNKKILDFGCGNALLLDFLQEKQINCDYYGWDISEKMINVAKKRHPKSNFKVVDILNEDFKEYSNFFDYILISGVFNGKFCVGTQVHKDWIEYTILKLWSLCNNGISVNFMTEYVDWKEDYLYYCPIGKITPFIVKNLSRWYVLRHDYRLWEYTMYIYKQPRAEIRCVK